MHGPGDHGAGAGRRRDAWARSMFRGNIVMKGYLKNQGIDRQGLRRRLVPFRRSRRQASGRLRPAAATAPRTSSSPAARTSPRSRSRTRCIEHPAVQLAAVVARPDEKWGETPCAFVEMKPGHTATADELIEWCRGALARYKCPRTSCSPRSRRPRPARCRSSCCGSGRRRSVRTRCERMRDQAWPLYCRALLVAFVASGRPSSRAALNWCRSACKTLKGRAIARFFLPSLGEPAQSRSPRSPSSVAVGRA